MNAAINRSERRAFVAKVRSRQSLKRSLFVLLVLLPALIYAVQTTALGAWGGDPLRHVAALAGLFALPMLSLSLVSLPKKASLAQSFTQFELACAWKTVAVLGFVLASIHIVIITQIGFSDVIAVIPAYGVYFIAPIAWKIALIVLTIGLLLATAVDVRGSGLQTVLQVLLWILTAVVVAIALLQLYSYQQGATNGKALASAFYSAAVIAVGSCLIGIYVGLIQPLFGKKNRYEIRAVEAVGDGFVEAILDYRGSGSAPVYLPGQSVVTDLGGGGRTNYFAQVIYDGTGAMRLAFPSDDGATALNGKVQPGKPVTLSYGQGVFRYDKLGAEGFVLVAMKYGVLAAMAVLRAMAEKRDRRKVILVLLREDPVAASYQDVLSELNDRLNLTVVTADAVGDLSETLRTVYPKERDRFDVLALGDGAMLKVVKRALKGLKVPKGNVWFERI